MKTKLAALALTSVLVLAACGQTTPPDAGQQPTTGTVEFTMPTGVNFTTVTNKATGEVVNVTDVNDDPQAVRLEGLPEGTFVVTFDADGFQPKAVEVMVAAGQTVTVPVPTLDPDPVAGPGSLIELVEPADAYPYALVVDRDEAKPGIQRFVNEDFIQAVMFGDVATDTTGEDFVQFGLPAGMTFVDGSFKVAAQHATDNAGNPLVAAEQKATMVPGTFVAAENAARVNIAVPAGNQVVGAVEVVPSQIGNFCFAAASLAEDKPVCFEIIEKPAQ